MGKETVTQVPKTHRVPGKINPRRITLRHLVVKLTETKYKDKRLKTKMEKQQIIYKGIPKVISGYLRRNCRPERTVILYGK